MHIDRRSVLGAGLAMTAAGGTASGATRAPAGTTPRLRRIATEEAWSTPEHLDAINRLTESGWNNLDIQNYWAMFHQGANGAGPQLERRLKDVDDRLRTMDENGIDMHVLSLTSPGVQLFDTETAVRMAALANDRLAAVVQARPTRFAGLGAFAPQDPVRAVREMERCMRDLHLNGFLVNSHTQDEYLDQPKYWPILEAAEALDATLYVHPRCPPDSMAGPFREQHIRAAIWGFAAECGTHAVRLLVSGVCDRFPKLRIMLGHLGENVPFHLWRINHFWEREPGAYGAKTSPAETFRRNFWVTTSGFADPAALRFVVDTLGAERVLWAVDYPYEPMEPFTRFMDALAMDPQQKARIYHRNAEQLFHIAPLGQEPTHA